jgi:predicted permease
MSEWMQDARYSLRLLRKSPGFTAVAVLSLALGIGVNTAVLGVARAALLTPLPVPEPERLAVAHWWRSDPTKGTIQFNSGGGTDPRTGRSLSTNYDYPTYLALRDAVREQADLFAFSFVRQASISLEGQPVMGGGMLVSGNYFSGLGVPLHLGRGIDDRDDREDAESVAVIGYGMWRRTFGGDPAILGKTVRVNGHAFTLIGVTARDYFGVSNGGFFPPADITVPLSAQPLVSPRWTAYLEGAGTLFTSDRSRWLRIMARLRPGVSAAHLEPHLAAAFTQRANASAYPLAAGAEPPMVVLQDGSRGLDSMRATLERPLLMLGGVAALVFLIACVNIASLVLVRGLARQQEFWIRRALGAGRRRLVRQTIVESMTLAAAGGLLGILLATWASPAIISTLAGTSATAIAVRLDLPLIALATGVSSLAAIGFGLVPAVRLAGRESADLMRQTGAGAPRLRGGRALVLAQVAIAMPLVLGAALFLRTIHNLASVELGFEPRGLVVFRMDPALNGYDEARSQALFRRVLDRLHQIPGATGATLVENSLVSGITSGTQFERPGEASRSLLMNRVAPGFFETFGIPVVAGRSLGIQDDRGSRRVAVINEAGARAFFGSTLVIGQQLRMSSSGTVVEIVGVSRDSKYSTLRRQARPTIYLPYFQSTGLTAMHVALRVPPAGTLEPMIRRAVAEVDSEVPITGLKTQTQQIEETIGSERALMMLLVFFGGFALVLACIGLHGVTAYSVARRTNEIGIRLALGAQRRSVLWLMLRQVVVLAVGGLLIGIPAAVFGSQAVASQLFGVEPTDLLSISVAAGVLFAVALAAGFLPARQASRLDPLVALRTE